jgi:hypothetical protein
MRLPLLISKVLSGFSTFTFGLDAATFTPGMVTRKPADGPFSAGAAFMLHGLDSKEGDSIVLPVGDRFGNGFYDNFDLNQGTIVFFLRPQYDGSLPSEIAYRKVFEIEDGFRLYLSTTPDLRVRFYNGNDWTFTSIPCPGAFLPGEQYLVAVSWTSQGTIDGSNNLRVTINNTHYYETIDLEGEWSVGEDMIFGAEFAASPFAAFSGEITGPFIYRRVLYGDGYGADLDGGIDVLDEIYNGGSFNDPTEITGGAWDVTLGAPTNATVGPLTSGVEHVWGFPHAQNPITPIAAYMADGFGPDQSKFIRYNTSDTKVIIPDGSSIQDLPLSGDFTVDIWLRSNGTAVSGNDFILAKGDTTSCGWTISLVAGYHFMVSVLADPISAYGVFFFEPGEKWYLLTMFFNGSGDRRIHLAVNGVWLDPFYELAASVGIKTDAGRDLVIGNKKLTTEAYHGDIGWCAIYDDDHHQHGVDFIPPNSPPTPGSNTIVQYNLDAGSGTLVENVAGDAAYNGVLSGGEWCNKWAFESDGMMDPVLPTSLEFVKYDDGGVLITNGPNISDLLLGDATIDFWVYIPEGTANGFRLFSKANGYPLTNGWEFYYLNNPVIVFRAMFSGGEIAVPGNISELNCWYLVSVDWDPTEKKAALYINGNLANTSPAATGTYASDAAYPPVLNSVGSIGMQDGSAQFGWVRLCNNRQWESSYFVNGRCNPPSNSPETQLLIRMDEGIGDTVADSSGNNYHGTITFGTNGRWNRSFELAEFAPQDLIYQGGYVLGSSGQGMMIGSGIYAEFDVSPGDSFVIRVVCHGDGKSQPRVIVYDKTNATEVSFLDGTTDSTGQVPDVLLFTVAAPAGCTCLQIKIINADIEGQGEIYVYLAEVLPNAIGNPSMILGSGDPWAPDNFGAFGYASGETAQDQSVYHSGGASLKILANSNGFIRTEALIGISQDSFASFGLCLRGGVRATLSGQMLNAQRFLSNTLQLYGASGVWSQIGMVVRRDTTTPYIYARFTTSEGYFDDWYLVPLRHIVSTVSPANRTNSLGASEHLMVNGGDVLSAAVDGLSSKNGGVEWQFRPQYDLSLAATFNVNPIIACLYRGANNQIIVFFSGSNEIGVSAICRGGPFITESGIDITGVFTLDESHLCRLEYQKNGKVCFMVDGVEIATLIYPGGIDFGEYILNVLYLNSHPTELRTFDGYVG